MGFLILPGIIENITTRKDKSWKVTIGTNELTPEQRAKLTDLVQEFCYVALKKEPFKQKEEQVIEQLQSELDFSGKSPSQRLRGILYLNWKQDPQGFNDQNTHYLHHMDKICVHYKSKLD